MSDIRLFKISGRSVEEIDGHSVVLEKSLQTLIEKHLEAFLGVRFLATEHATGKTHGGRIDTLGVDENRCPVIIEYKRSTNQNVINQGLYYLDWLLDHKAEFKLLVLEHCDKKTADALEWDNPRLLCIAGDFTKFDEHAVQQMNRNIELIRYRRYGDDLLLLDLVNRVEATPPPGPKPRKRLPGDSSAAQSVVEQLAKADSRLQNLFNDIETYLRSAGDDVQMKQMKWYYAFRRLRNFACVHVQYTKNRFLIWTRLDPKSVVLEKGFTRPWSKIDNDGTLEITIRNAKDFEKAKPLLDRAYEGG